MKKFKPLLVLSFCLVFFGGIAQETNYVVVKLFEPINAAGEIIISYGKDKSERIAVEKLDSDHHENNMNKLVDVFNRMNKKGFVLVSTAASAQGNPASILHVDTFVFSRKD